MVSVVGQLYINFIRCLCSLFLVRKLCLMATTDGEKKLSFQKQNLQIDILDDNLI